MPRFKVAITETSTAYYSVEAESAEEAVDLVSEGDGRVEFLEMSDPIEQSDVRVVGVEE